MALHKKIDEYDIAYLEVIEDPIWFGEFLRTTSDGESERALWPAIEWNYRDYQRQFLSDESEFILYTGGRAIGKCSPSHARVLVYGHGYKTLGELAKEKYFITYSLTPEMTVEPHRAFCLRDSQTTVYKVKTASGHEFVGTKNHPLLTPNGYKLIQDITEQDQVAIATKLPHDSTRTALRWHELRLLGYVFFYGPRYTPARLINPKYPKRMGAELEEIAKRFGMNWRKTFAGEYSFHSKPSKFKSPMNALFEQCGIFNTLRSWNRVMAGIPDIIKEECLDNIRVFLEPLFGQYASISKNGLEISLTTQHIQCARDIQELLLRYGIEARIEDKTVHLLDYRAVYRFWQTFDIPGIGKGTFRLPEASLDATDFMRFDNVITKYQEGELIHTYAVHVYEDKNYIGDNFYVHNSVVLEDKIVWEVVNQDIAFPETKEAVLTTANKAQMQPLLSKLIQRFTSSKYLSKFLNGQINRSDGVMEFSQYGKPLPYYFRIAGKTGEANLVGLHAPRIRADEVQIFPLPAFTQLQPAYNSWNKGRQQIWAGVPNGVRNSVLYQLDHTPKYKKYHIPSHNNPFYTLEDDIDNIKRYGGEQDDRYQNLVLGRHGAAAFQVIPRETIVIEPLDKFPFYSGRYNSSYINRGKFYHEILETPPIPHEVDQLVVACDTGFTDSTIILVCGRDKQGIWRNYIRYRLNRVTYDIQEQIIDWVAQSYKAHIVALDAGAGGQGGALIHNLMYRDEYKSRNYDKRLIGVQFSEKIVAGYDDQGEELKQDTKTYAAEQLAEMIQRGRITLSEIDYEGISQIERIAKRKSLNGRDIYFVLSDKGAGADEDDHIFAAWIVFIMAIRNGVSAPRLTKLGKSGGVYR